MAAAAGTGGAIVCVPGHPLMLAVEIVLIIVLVAGGAAERARIVGCMAFHASIPFVLIAMLCAAVNREACGSIHVVRCTERRRRAPCALCMTHGTVAVEIHRRMVRRRYRACEIRLMTLVAVHVGQLVIAVDVTIQTRRSCMCTLQRERRR